MTEHAVVVAGGGPTGLMLAAEVALAGVDAVVVERRATQDLEGTRSRGLHARTIEVLDQRGIAGRFVSEGQTFPFVGFAQSQLDISDFPTRHNYLLALSQTHCERILSEWVAELGVTILRGREVTGFTQDDEGVDVALSDGTRLRARYLAGCDGGRSLVRKTAGIEFRGVDPSTSWIIAEVAMDERPPIGVRREGGGIGPVDPGAGDGLYGVALPESALGQSDPPTMEHLRDALVAAYGTDFSAHSPVWISRFDDTTRQAATYRAERVLLAGDAAHVHMPMGGQGLQTGVQDAVNLGWKLGQVIRGISPDSLLDTYHAERHPVGARVLRNTMAQGALVTPGERHEALRETVADLVALDESRRRIVGMISGLDIRYDLGEGHPLVGRRIPDLDLQTRKGTTRVFTLLHEARPVLLALGDPDGFDLAPWAGVIRRVDARYEGAWELPVIGEVPAPESVLIRPDGYVAWAGDPRAPGLTEALTHWFGAAGRPGTGLGGLGPEIRAEI